jgi:hypothetical protein
VALVASEQSLHQWAQPVTESLVEVPLYQFLDRLERIGVDWKFEQGLVTLLPKEASLRNVQYNIGDLLDFEFKASDLIRAMTDSVEPESWVDGGWDGRLVLGSRVSRASRPSSEKTANC